MDMQVFVVYVELDCEYVAFKAPLIKQPKYSPSKWNEYAAWSGGMGADVVPDPIFIRNIQD